jgi:hypothetical protein
MKELNRMREQKFVARISLLFAASTLLSVGCAHYSTLSPSSPQQRKSAQVISADPHADPLKSLESELSTVQSDRVIVSTALLRSLVRNERTQQNQCKNISGQLEALKNIDLQEAGVATE